MKRYSIAIATAIVLGVVILSTLAVKETWSWSEARIVSVTAQIGTMTATAPTPTATFTETPTPTPSITPTITPTTILGCNGTISSGSSIYEYPSLLADKETVDANAPITVLAELPNEPLWIALKTVSTQYRWALRPTVNLDEGCSPAQIGLEQLPTSFYGKEPLFADSFVSNLWVTAPGVNISTLATDRFGNADFVLPLGNGAFGNYVEATLAKPVSLGNFRLVLGFNRKSGDWSNTYIAIRFRVDPVQKNYYELRMLRNECGLQLLRNTLSGEEIIRDIPMNQTDGCTGNNEAQNLLIMTVQNETLTGTFNSQNIVETNLGFKAPSTGSIELVSSQSYAEFYFILMTTP